MKFDLCLGLSVIFLSLPSFSQELLIPNRTEVVVDELTTQNIDEVATILQTSKMGANLKCSIHVEQTKELKKFLSGERWVEMLRVDYTNSGEYDGIPMRAYFAVGSKLTRSMTNSEFGGIVEELELESGDRTDHWLTVQHDGNGHIVWASMGDTFSPNPCQLRH